jgi:hypothetical protein
VNNSGRLTLEMAESCIIHHRPSQQSVVRDVLKILIHLVGFLCLRELVFSLGSLNAHAFSSPSLIREVAANCATNYLFWLSAAVFVLMRSRTLARWTALEHGRSYRWFASGLAVALAITLAGQPINLFFAQEHLTDRCALLILSALILVRPVFILPFAAIAVAVGGQFAFPLAGYGWEGHLLGIYRLPIHLLLIIQCGASFGTADSEADSRSTILLVAVVIAAGYWVPGIAKLRMGWATIPNVHYSFFGAWCHGWLSFVPAERVAKITNELRPFALPLQWVTLMIECGAVLVLVRRIALFLFPMWILLHLGIFVMYGYAFWMWAMIDLCVFLFVLRRPAEFTFRWQYCLIALILVGTSGRWLKPNKLAWFNTPLSNVFRVVAISDSGATYDLSPRFFAPYDYIFTMQMFGFASAHQQLTGPYGATSDVRLTGRSGPELAAAQFKKAGTRPNTNRANELKTLIAACVRNRDTARRQATVFAWLRTPPLLNTTLSECPIPDGERIRFVRLIRIRSFLTADTVVREEVEECLMIEIPRTK